MAIPLLLFLLTLFPHLMLICSATHDEQLSPLSAQIKFWHENVQNEMPNLIAKKLSPLNKQNSDIYTSMISKNDKFTADSKFCSLAKLSCTSFGAPITSSFRIRLSFYRIRYTTSKSSYNNEDKFVFFRLSALKSGNLVHLPNLKEDALPDRAFLPSQIASKISLGPTNKITKMFPGSALRATKETVETTLLNCNAEPMHGEVKSCPRSLEEMISFSKSSLGGKKLLAFTSKISEKYSNTELVIKNVKKVNGDKNVVCHESFLPFSIFYCHLIYSTSLYEVDFVEPKTGAHVNTMLVICHMDTSDFSEDHIALQMLKLRPGQGEVCHWFSQADLAWISADGN